ncbi:MAG TPA: MarR family winged helix-turn-helix transcriptional regulator [Thermomonospora sp.]|nr:MarR family winged helix-turn-helix transcriptional regulator [Thermomonospora sp.]
MQTPPSNPAGDPGHDDVALGRLLATAHQHARRILDEALGHLGIEARHFGVLAALDRHGPASQRELSTLLDLDKSAMVRIMDELERRGLAVRNRNARDRRAYAIELTAQGREKARASTEAATRAAARLFGTLTPADRERLVAALTQIIDRATPG